MNTKPSGAFFHPVPDDDNNNDSDSDNDNDANEQREDSYQFSSKGSSNNEEDEEYDENLDTSLEKLIKERQKPSLASQPSTINGIPTSQTGVGLGGSQSQAQKKKKEEQSQKPYVGIGTPDKPLNDVTRPEYDDQGYTLYADEETGEKSRVFEALVEYPCEFTMKIVGANEGTFVAEILQVVAESCEVSDVGDIRHSTRTMGKWTSVTVEAPVQSAEMLYQLYENVDRDPRVKFKF